MKSWWWGLGCVVLFCCSAYSQVDTISLNGDSTACPDGKKFHWAMATSGCFTVSGCYSDEEWHEETRFIAKCSCEETSIGFLTADWGFGDSHTWDDSLGCVSKKQWWIWGDREKIFLSEAQFDSMITARRKTEKENQ